MTEQDRPDQQGTEAEVADQATGVEELNPEGVGGTMGEPNSFEPEEDEDADVDTDAS